VKILFLTTVFPGHGRTGGDLASQRYVDALRAAGAEVHTLSYLRPSDPGPTHAHDHIAGRRAIETADSGARAWTWLAASFLRGTPYSAEKYRSRAYLRAAAELTRDHTFDFCVLDHASRLTWVLPGLPRELRVVANTHNIEHRLYERLRDGAGSAARRAIYAREARLVSAIERALPARVSEVWTLTEQDGDFHRGLPGAVRVRAFATPPADVRPPDPLPSPRHDIGLLGNWQWTANREGLDWFMDQCVPLLPASLSVEIAGKGADDLAGRDPRVTVRGFVPDAEAFLCAARVLAIPTINGAGVQIKALNALALGLPVVATTFAVHGIHELPPTVRIADTADAFAADLAQAASMPRAPADPAALDWARRRIGAFADAIDEALRDNSATRGARSC
jgi:hypothetical protein